MYRCHRVAYMINFQINECLNIWHKINSIQNFTVFLFKFELADIQNGNNLFQTFEKNAFELLLFLLLFFTSVFIMRTFIHFLAGRYIHLNLQEIDRP